MRNQGCEDLIEYYDYNVNVEEHAKRLSPLIVSGNFRPSRSLVLHLNKADGLVRRVQIPTPDDALVFQVITESILPLVNRSAPTTKAYFSRSHATPRGIHTMDVPGIYPWFKIWPKYQTDILDFTRAHKYLVITDIQNFFDSVPHSAIDRALSLIGVEQSIRDIVLFMLESFVERELYAPLVRRGLPQLDLDAPRLLAHLLLFNMDRYLVRRTKGAVARWVDDINFGVETKAEARHILRALENFLARIELRLNGRKTQTLSRQQAEDYLCVHENFKLTSYQRELRSPTMAVERIEDLIEDFLHFVEKGTKAGHWDQVYRRYVGQITQTERMHIDSKQLRPLRKKLRDHFDDHFNEFVDYRMRETLLRFWEVQNPKAKSVRALLLRFRDVSSTDDVIAFKLARLICSTNLSPAMQKVITKNIHYASIRPGGLTGMAMLLCKYADASSIENFINATADRWSTNDFLARQMICLWSVLAPASDISIRLHRVLLGRIQRGPADLLRYFEDLRCVKVLPKGLEGYVSPAKMKRPYTLAKAIVSSNLFRSTLVPAQTRTRIEGAFTKVSDARLVGIALNKIHV